MGAVNFAGEGGSELNIDVSGTTPPSMGGTGEGPVNFAGSGKEDVKHAFDSKSASPSKDMSGASLVNWAGDGMKD